MNSKVRAALFLAVAALLLRSLQDLFNLTLASENLFGLQPKQNDLNTPTSRTTALAVWNETRTLKLQSWLSHIYYFNSFVNPESERFMESWLQSTGHSHIERVEEVSGSTEHLEMCNVLGDSRCAMQESKRISQTYQRFGHAYKKGGVALILHHDNIYVDLEKLHNVVTTELEDRKIDWSVLRLDCGQHANKESITKANTFYLEKGYASDTNDSLCGESKAIVWRNGKLKKMSKLLTTLTVDKPNAIHIDCLLQRTDFESYCLDYPGLIQQNPNLIMRPTPIFGTWNYGRNQRTEKQDINRVHQQMPHKDERESLAVLDRILYVNLAKNRLRRQFMESWLSRQSIPYQRVNGMSIDVEAEACAFNKSKEVCRGIVGYLATLLNVLDTMTDSQQVGNTMILEDDMLPSDSTLYRLVQAMKIVPSDWELVRFDCWGMQVFDFQWANPFVADTSSYKIKGCENNATACRKTFCGGGHSMVFSTRGIQKLKLMWSTKP